MFKIKHLIKIFASLYFVGISLGYTSLNGDDPQHHAPLPYANPPTVYVDNPQPDINPLMVYLVTLKNDIYRCHETADTLTLRKLYTDFQAIKPQYSDEDWRLASNALQAIRWTPAQSKFEMVGSLIFFPTHHVNKMRESKYTEHLIGRRDMMWAYAISAKFKNLLGLFYLGERFHYINRNYGDEPVYGHEIYESFLNDSFPGLNQHLDHPDVAYAVGRGHDISPYVSSRYNTDESIDLHRRGHDHKNQLQVLEMRNRRSPFHTHVPAPETTEFETLGLSYPAAYLSAIYVAKRLGDDVKAKFLLQQAVDAEYAPAYIDYAFQQPDGESWELWLNRAGDQGIPDGFVICGRSIVGDVKRDDNKQLEGLASKDSDDAAELFTKAVRAHDPVGYEYLGYLYYRLRTLSADNVERKELLDKVIDTWKAGCVLGWLPCYEAIIDFTTEKLCIEIEDEVGYAPSVSFAQQLRDFIDHE